MYIRITTITYDPAQEEALLSLVEEQMIPAFKRQPGFVRYYGGVDRSTQRAVAVTVWDDMEHAAGLRTALGGLIQQLEAIGVRFEPAQLYEVTTQA
ncbi:MAG: antibiotic biosynthesis monooxygenase [Caldilineaceae bacterium]